MADPQIAAPRWRLKEWQYLSVTSDGWFLALAMVQTGYVANLFAYLVDRRTPHSAWQTEHLSPLGRALKVAPSSLHGVSQWRGAGQQVTVTAATADDGQARWDWQLDLRLRDHRGEQFALQGSLRVLGGGALALVHRLAGDRPAYTHKEAGQRVSGQWQLVGANGPHMDWRGDGGDSTLATLDWTRALALRTTRWNWASAVGLLPGGRRFGLNLSAHVYDDARGHSRENAVWRDGQPSAIGGVAFELPADPVSQPWRIRSLQGDSVGLLFTPCGARRQHLELGLVASRFVQPWGHFDGQLRTADGETLTLQRVWGVVEDHLARW